MSLSTTNPYLNHPQLSSLEQEVLWEYAKLGDKTKRIAALAKDTSENPNEPLLAELRTLEKRMGLVLTLYKSAVFGLFTEMKDKEAQEEIQRRAEEEQQRGAQLQHQQQHQGDYTEDSYEEY